MVVFVLLFFVVTTSLHFLQLPFTNPHEVVGQMALLHQNPLTNVIKFLLLLAVPSIFMFLPLDSFTRKPHITRTIKIVLLSLTLFTTIVVFGLYFPIHLGYHPAGLLSPLNSFLEGEGLGAVTNYLFGDIPYKNIVLLHGPIEDIFVSKWAFSLFGRSIISVRLLNSILTSINFILLLTLIYHLFEKKLMPSLAVFFIFCTLSLVPTFDFNILVMRRELSLLVVILSVLFLKKTLKTGQNPQAALFLMTFLSSLSFAYSGDRGLYLTATTLFILFPTYFLLLKSRKYLLSILGGLLFGFLVFGYSIDWAYLDFIKYFFIMMPRYKGLRSGLLYDYSSTFLIPVLIVSGLVFWLFSKFKNREISVTHFLYHFYIEIYLIILSVFFMYSIVARMDVTRLNRNLLPIFLASSLVGFKYIKSSTVTTLALILGLNFSLNFFPALKFKDLFVLPQSFDDQQLIPKEYAPVISYLKENLGPADSFLSMTNDGIWYYLLDRPSPIRFQSIYNAASNVYQQEVIDDLMKKNVKFFVIGKGAGPWNYDNISVQKRVPYIWKYLSETYQPVQFSHEHNDEHFEIWRKNN